MKKLLVATMITCCSVSAFAESNGSFGAKLSTLGFGLEYTLPVHEKVDLGLGLNYFQYKRDFKKEDLDFKAKAKLFTFGPTAYFYPANNGFNINAGLFYNGNKFDADIKPKNDTYIINGKEYPVHYIENAQGTLKMNKIAPYLGVGYKSGDRNKDGLAFDVNLGMMFHGRPKVTLDISCSNEFPETNVETNFDRCSFLQKDVKAEQKKLNDDVKGYKIHPVVSAGFIYRF